MSFLHNDYTDDFIKAKPTPAIRVSSTSAIMGSAMPVLLPAIFLR